MPGPQVRARPLLLATLTGVLEGMCFAPTSLWFLAFVAPAPLIVAARGATPGAAALYGWLAGTFASALAVTPWITAATLGYFRQGPAGALLFATLVGQVFHALPTTAFAVGVQRLERLPVAIVRIVAIASLWTALELLRSRVLTGAPWDLVGHALWAHPLWLQVADLGGVYAVSFGCLTVAACLAELGRAPVAALTTGLAVLALWAGYGAVRLAHEHDDGTTVRIALVQGAVPNAWRANPGMVDASFAAYAEATRRVLGNAPALVVWPENAISFLLDPNERFAAAIAALLGPGGPRLLVGGPRVAQPEPGRAQFFNAAYLLDPDGRVVATYDKRRLVPFAEYAPLPRLAALGWRFAAPGDYTRGSRATIFREPAPFGVLICFEAIYADLTRDLVRGGAELLLNLSNDAWFGTGAGLEQHFAITVLRAVEFRRALARATNTGVTALIGPSGRVLKRFPMERRDGWVVTVPRRTGLTPYALAGDAFAAAAAGFAAGGLLAARGRRPR
jgi:apolipoprotein N-acyltransferase